jgi:exopolysaccharide biosynthesis polyprenyl glycosylphosphotransferase
MDIRNLSAPERPLSAEAFARAVELRVPGALSDVRAERPDPSATGLLRKMFLVVDVLTAGVVIAVLAAFGAGTEQLFWAALVLPVWPVLAKLHGLYDFDERALRHLTVDEFPALSVWVATGVAVQGIVVAVSPASGLGMTPLLVAWATAVGTAFALRGGSRGIWRRVTPPERVFIIGSGSLAASVFRKLQLFPDMHIVIAGEDSEWPEDEYGERSLLPGIDRVVLASEAIDEDLVTHVLEICRAAGVKLSVVPPARGIFTAGIRLNRLVDMPLIEYATWSISPWTLLVKRSFDILASSVLLILLFPLLVIVALAVRLDSAGPVLFVQQRTGLGRRLFAMYKFRTMVDGAHTFGTDDGVGSEGATLARLKPRNDPRVTRVGRILRRASIDELPQLVNVLRGDMSIVGPRPWMESELSGLERAHGPLPLPLAGKPGLTGPMQISGRGELTFEERLAVECEYVENLTIGRDIRIIVLTLVPLVSGRGAF